MRVPKRRRPPRLHPESHTCLIALLLALGYALVVGYVVALLIHIRAIP